MSERNYYLVDKDSPVMGVIEKAVGYQRAFHGFLESLKKEFGACDVMTYSHARLAGLVFDGEIPNGWRQKAGEKFCVPDARSKTGREIKKRTYPIGVDAWRFSDMLGRGYSPYAEGHVYLTTYERYGDTYVLSVPVQCEVEPEGCTLLKMSEYWRIVEDAKEKAA